MWRGDYHCLLECKLVDSSTIRPILDRKACIGMKLIKYMDNDEVNKPITTAHIYVVNQELQQLTKDVLITKYPKVFDEGENHIKLDATIDPVQHAPRRVLVALRTQTKDALDGVQVEQIIELIAKYQFASGSTEERHKQTSNLRRFQRSE